MNIRLKLCHSRYWKSSLDIIMKWKHNLSAYSMVICMHLAFQHYLSNSFRNKKFTIVPKKNVLNWSISNCEYRERERERRKEKSGSYLNEIKACLSNYKTHIRSAKKHRKKDSGTAIRSFGIELNRKCTHILERYHHQFTFSGWLRIERISSRHCRIIDCIQFIWKVVFVQILGVSLFANGNKYSNAGVIQQKCMRCGRGDGEGGAKWKRGASGIFCSRLPLDSDVHQVEVLRSSGRDCLIRRILIASISACTQFRRNESNRIKQIKGIWFATLHPNCRSIQLFMQWKNKPNKHKRNAILAGL